MAQFNRQYLGKPVSTVKPALKRVWEQHFDKIDDRKLTEYAKLVSEGTRPLVRHRLARGERGDSVGVHAPDRPGVLGMGTDAPVEAVRPVVRCSHQSRTQSSNAANGTFPRSGTRGGKGAWTKESPDAAVPDFVRRRLDGPHPRRGLA
jgi:hypothetical protein